MRRPPAVKLLSAIVLSFAFSALPAMAAEPSPPGATSCSGCHAAGSPFGALAGAKADDVEQAMAAFRSGERPSTVMARIAKGFSDPEAKAIAQWWAQQEPER